MPVGSQKILPKFSGDKKVTTDQHISAFFTASGVLAIQHEDVSVRLFVETLTKAAAKWFS